MHCFELEAEQVSRYRNTVIEKLRDWERLDRISDELANLSEICLENNWTNFTDKMLKNTKITII